MRTIVIKSENKELIESIEKLAEMFSCASGIEEELKAQPGKINLEGFMKSIVQSVEECARKKMPEEKTPEEEGRHEKFVSLSAYEELEKMLDDTIEERDKLERENYKLTKQNESLRKFVAEFMVKANEL